MYVVTVKFVVKDARRNEFRSAVVQQAKNSVQLEAGCHVFDVGESTGKQGTFFLYEKYTDSAAFDEHLKSRHFHDFDALVGSWVEAKTVETWDDLEVTV
jgi:quinol monooxygenase YgiN